MMRPCSSCATVTDEYYLSGGHRQCKPCIRRKVRERAAADPRKTRSSELLSKFGITLDQYERMLEDQDGLCAICRKTCPTGRNLAVDHDRACCPGAKSCGGCVRALLCVLCNNGIGCFEDNIALLSAASSYIQRFK